MSDIDAQALAEFQGATQGEQDGTQETEGQEEAVEYFELPYNGNNIRLPMNHEIPIPNEGGIQNVQLSTLLNKYRLASHLENKQKEWKEKMTTFEQEQAEFGNWKELHNKYGAIQKWSEEEPDQWQALWDLYQNKDIHLAGDQQNNALLQEINNLRNELGGLKEFQQSVMSEREEAEVNSQVDSVNSEIASFKEEFSHINLDETDLDGISLRGNILKFGAEGNYPNFRAAALDYKFPDGTPLLTKLIDTVKREGRNEAVKAVKQDNRNGILSRSSTPNLGQGQNVDVRRLSSDDRDDMALNELLKSWNG